MPLIPPPLPTAAGAFRAANMYSIATLCTRCGMWWPSASTRAPSPRDSR